MRPLLFSISPIILIISSNLPKKNKPPPTSTQRNYSENAYGRPEMKRKSYTETRQKLSGKRMKMMRYYGRVVQGANNL